MPMIRTSELLGQAKRAQFQKLSLVGHLLRSLGRTVSQFISWVSHMSMCVCELYLTWAVFST